MSKPTTQLNTVEELDLSRIEQNSELTEHSVPSTVFMDDQVEEETNIHISFYPNTYDDPEDLSNLTPLHLAVARGHVATVARLRL